MLIKADIPTNTMTEEEEEKWNMIVEKWFCKDLFDYMLRWNRKPK